MSEHPLCTQAVVLVGGEGTRLRPITSRVPKPVAPVVERPFITYVLDLLARHGVQRVIFSSGFLASAIETECGDGLQYGIAVEHVVESEPLGTAGAIKNVQSRLDDGPLFALNGDVLTDVDLGALARLHKEKAAMATIFLTPVEDPRRYGLVCVRPDASVSSFVEKPGNEHSGGGLINAGVYVLEPPVLEMIPAGRMFSIERGVFPKLAQAGSLFAFVGAAYWRDIGTPESYLQAHFDILEGALKTAVADELGPGYVHVSSSARVAATARIVPPSYVADGAEVGAGAQVGPLAVIGAGASVGEGATVVESVVQAGARVGAHASVEGSVLVRDSWVGAGTQVSHAILGEACRVGAGNRLANGICLHPGVELPDDSVQFRDVEQSGEGR